MGTHTTKFKRDNHQMEIVKKKADYNSDSDCDTMKSKLSGEDERDSGIETTQTTRIEQVKCNQSVIDMDTMGHLDEKSLLTSMYDRFKSKKDTCTKNARYHQGLNYVISCLLIIFQIVLIAINQIDTDRISQTKTCSVILPALTAAFIGLQLRLRLGEKAEAFRRKSGRYAMLLATTTYKLQIISCGGRLQDVRQFWREAMKIEEELTSINH